MLSEGSCGTVSRTYLIGQTIGRGQHDLATPDTKRSFGLEFAQDDRYRFAGAADHRCQILVGQLDSQVDFAICRAAILLGKLQQQVNQTLPVRPEE